MIGIGEISLDRVAELEVLPEPGGKAELASWSLRPGGQIATAALGCARLGLRSAYLGSLGEDADARAALAPLREAGVDLAGVVQVSTAATRMALVLVETGSGERRVLWRRDPGLRLRPRDLERARIAAARVLLIDAIDPEASLWAARVARDADTAVVLDADAFRPELEPLLALVDFPIVSRGFAETSGDGGVRKCLASLARRGARLAVVTLGARGALARGGGRELESPAFAVGAVDSTGAGDAFRAGFAWGLLEGWGAERTLRAANAMGAIACTARGAQGGLPTRSALEAFLRSERPGTGPVLEEAMR